MTKEQSQAADFLWNAPNVDNLQLIAGAGSGKTTTLIESVYNCSQNYCKPEKICMLTFSKKAAAEMKERLDKRGLSVGFLGTIHALSYKLLRDKSQRKLQIIESNAKIFSKLIQERHPELLYIPVEILLTFPEGRDAKIDRLRKEYDSYKREKNLYDFEDLILRSTELLKKGSLAPPFKAILIDEFQDTSYSQLDFLRALQPDKTFTVGDDWQSIYKFRGAEVSICMNFLKSFPNSKRLFLTKNFRSQKRIVDLGNHFIRLSDSYIAKKLTAFYKSGFKPICHIVNAINTHPGDYWLRFLEWLERQKENQNFTVLVRTNQEKKYLIQQIHKTKTKGFEVMTLHSSKGLEFEHVIIWGIEKDKIPHRWGDYDEEVRLFYVGITRAKESLQFLAIEERSFHSDFLPFLTSKCKLNYI